MKTLHIKSKDERTVISIRGKNPQMDQWHIDKGYSEIDPKEFRRIKARILRGPTQTATDAVAVEQSQKGE